MITFETSGSFQNTEDFLKRMSKGDIFSELKKFGQAGADALARNTPTGEGTGKTASSWDFQVVKKRGSYSVEWFNTNVNDGVQVAVLIQYGHGTGTGGYVAGIDYINPAIQPIFDQAITTIWNEVKR